LAEPEPDTSGDFREPHPEDPVELTPEEILHSQADSHAEAMSEPPVEIVPELAAELPPAPAPEPEPERERRPERPPQPEYRRPEPRPWVKPADFRPAEVSAISQAVAHATQIAEALKHTIDELDEILELVEIAERQKLADEREIEELRRALRRIQPPRQQQHAPRGPRHDEPHRGHREYNPNPNPNPRHEESRYARPEPREPMPRPEEPPRPPDAGEPPAHVD
jgi:hypothetical protein